MYVHEHQLRYSSSTTGVGAIRDFYSTVEDTRADDNITATESALGEMLDRTIRTKALPPNGEVAMLFGALSIRTLKMQSAMLELAPAVISALRKKSTDQALALETFDKQINDEAWIEAQVNKELRKYVRIDRNKRAALKAFIKRHAKKMLEDKKLEFLKAFNEHSNCVFNHLEQQAAAIANGALSRFFTDTSGFEKRNMFFRQFNYALVERTEEPFVLGDCAVVALDNQSQPCLALGDAGEGVVLDQIFLPISPDLLIRGARDPAIPFPENKQINRLSAMLSHRFFISLEESTPHIDELKNLLGAATSPIMNLEELANW